MKKQLLIIFTALSIGQYSAIITQNNFSNARTSLNNITTFFKSEWNPVTKKLDPYSKIAFASAIQTITDYAKENSKNTEIVSLAKTLCDINQQIINLCEQAELLNTIDLATKTNSKNTIIDKVESLTQELSQMDSKITKNIFEQKAKDALDDAIFRQLLILASIKNTITRII